MIKKIFKNKCKKIKVNFYNTIDDLKRKLLSLEKIDVDLAKVFFNNKQLFSNLTLYEYGIREKSTIQIDWIICNYLLDNTRKYLSSIPISKEEEIISIYLKFLNNPKNKVPECVAERGQQQSKTKKYSLNYILITNGYYYIGQGIKNRPMDHLAEAYFAYKLIKDDKKAINDGSDVGKKIKTLVHSLLTGKPIELVRFNKFKSKCLVQLVEAVLINLFNQDMGIEFGKGLMNSQSEIVNLFKKKMQMQMKIKILF